MYWAFIELQNYMPQNSYWRKYRYYLIGIGGFFILALVGIFLSLNFIIKSRIASVRQKIETKYQAKLLLGNYEVAGIDAISFPYIKLIKNNIPVVALEDVRLGINWRSLLHANLRLSKLHIASGKIIYHTTDSPTVVPHTQTKASLNSRYGRIIDRLFLAIPDQFEVKNLIAEYYSATDTYNLKINQCTLIKNVLNFRAEVNNYPIQINGTLIPADRKADVVVNGSPNLPLPIPKRFNKWNIKLFTERTHVSVNEWDYDSDESQFNIAIHAQNNGIFHTKIDNDTIYFPSIHAELNGHMEDEYLELDSSSTIKIKDYLFHPFILIDVQTDTIITLAWNAPSQKGQYLFDALPKNAFSTFAGIQASGNVDWRFKIKHHFGKPDSLLIESELKPQNLRILKYGTVDYRIINGKFEYTPYFNPRKIIIGEGNYVPYDAISPILIYSVLNSEDGGYFVHRGFNMSSLRESAVEDLKLGYFRRGGSTITMQLVKNIFLGHQKKITRKLEEMLIVWLIENLHLCSKKRMLEVYLNAIEWGPNVYGIAEASHFYFSKHPSQLSLEEAIFLAMIIPHPRAYSIHFDIKTGSLLQANLTYFKFIAQKLLAQKIITASQEQNLDLENVILSLSARKGLRLEAGAGRFTKKEAHAKILQVIQDSKQETDVPELPSEILEP
jgi:hypothetical protein